MILWGVGTVSAETIHLQSNQIVQGDIVEGNDEYILVDVGLSTPIRFYHDEIRSIETFGETHQERLSSSQDSFLWRVSTLHTTVYLMGSIHLGKPSMYPLDPDIELAFQVSDHLVVEVDIDALDPLQTQQKMLSLGMYADGDSLTDNITPQTLRKLEKRMEGYGLEPSYFTLFKPWFVALSLTVMQIKQLGFDENYGIDKYFLGKARDRMPILEIESLDEQLSLLAGLPDQELFLEFTLNTLDDTEKMLDVLLKAWQEGDAATMGQIMISQALEKYPQTRPIYEKIFFERNRNMTQKIQEYLEKEGTYFVVVGAGHLVGEKGIVALLKKAGFEVEQL